MPGQPYLRLHPEFLLPSKIHPKYHPLVNTGSCRTNIQASLRNKQLKQRANLWPSFILKLLAIIPWALGTFSFSANPILGCLSLPLATSSYGPSLLLPSNLIRSVSRPHPFGMGDLGIILRGTLKPEGVLIENKKTSAGEDMEILG